MAGSRSSARGARGRARRLAARSSSVVVATAVIVALVAFAAVPSDARSPWTPAPRPQASADAALAAAAAKGPVPVIAELSGAGMPSAATASGFRARRRAVSEASARLATALPHRSVSHVRAIGSQPMVAMTVDATGLAALRAQPGVVRVVRDGLNRLTAAVSQPATAYSDNLTRIGAPAAWAAGKTGTGQTVAVLDTGVDGTSPFLAGKIVAEACFSGGGLDAESFCPGGALQSTGAGSAAPCPLLDEGCFHGTHVAGIAAGGAGGSFSGVAPGAKIIAVQVFSNVGGEVLAYDSDVMSALDYVYGLRSSFSIASVNLSLGAAASSYSSNYHCDTDPRKPMIDELRAAGIATVIASGNEFADQVDAPACISSAIAVGSVNADTDSASAFSDVSPALTLYAPGDSNVGGILSSVPAGTDDIPGEAALAPCPSPYAAGTCAYVAGTSMATPHVAGAIAVLRQARPGLSVGNEIDQLDGTGVPNDDVGLTFPSLRLGNAITQVRPTSFPGGVAQDKDGRFEAFKASSSGVADKWQTAVNSGWSGWVSRGGPVRNAPIAASNYDGRLEVFGTSASGVVYHAWQTSPGGSWSGWASLGGAVSGNHLTVVMNADGHLELLMVSTGNVVEHDWQTSPGGAWSGWRTMGTSVPGVRGITSMRMPDGRGRMSLVTGQGELLTVVQRSASGPWGAFTILNPPQGAPSPPMVGNPATGVDLDGRTEVLVADSSGRAWTWFETYRESGLQRHVQIGSGVTTGGLTVGHDADGRLELFDARSTGTVLDMWQKSPGSPWAGPVTLASSVGSIPSPVQAMSTVDGRIELFSAQGSDHDWQVHANGPWSGWRAF